MTTLSSRLIWLMMRRLSEMWISGSSRKRRFAARLGAVLALVSRVRGARIAARIGFVGRAGTGASRVAGCVLVKVVWRLRPDRAARRIAPAKPELIKHLRTNTEITVQLEHRSGMRPPVLREHVLLAALASAHAGAFAVLAFQLCGVIARLGPGRNRSKAARRRAGNGRRRWGFVRHGSGRGLCDGGLVFVRGVRFGGCALRFSNGCACGFGRRVRERWDGQKTERKQCGDGGLFHADLRGVPAAGPGGFRTRGQRLSTARPRGSESPRLRAYLRNAAMMSVPT